MGNICVTNSLKEWEILSKMTDDELLSEIQKEIHKGIEMNLPEIRIANVATHVYFYRFSINNSAIINLDKIKKLIDTYKKPYILTLGRPYAFIIQFVNFPNTS